MENFFEGTQAQPRAYQQRLCTKVMQILDGTFVDERGEVSPQVKSVLIEAPTGAGKTVMALALAQMAHRRGLRVGFVAMRRNLLEQTAEMRDRLGFDVGDMKLISMFDPDPPKDVDWLIIDEAQHDSTSSMARIHSTLQPKKVIGLSATPYRSDRAQLSFERKVRDVGIEEGYLSKFDHYTIHKYSPDSIVELFRSDAQKWGKSCAFFLNKEECDRTSALLSEIGIPNEVVWAQSDRKAQLERFRTGKVQVLISMGILTEGFDADDMKTVFVRPSSKLPTVQMCGRVLRTNEQVGRKQIVQCQKTRYPFVRIAPSETSYMQVQGGFRSLGTNSDIEKIVNQYAKKVVRAEPTLPAFLHRKKFSRPDRV